MSFAYVCAQIKTTDYLMFFLADGKSKPKERKTVKGQ